MVLDTAKGGMGRPMEDVCTDLLQRVQEGGVNLTGVRALQYALIGYQDLLDDTAVTNKRWRQLQTWIHQNGPEIPSRRWEDTTDCEAAATLRGMLQEGYIPMTLMLMQEIYENIRVPEDVPADYLPRRIRAYLTGPDKRGNILCLARELVNTGGTAVARHAIVGELGHWRTIDLESTAWHLKGPAMPRPVRSTGPTQRMAVSNEVLFARTMAQMRTSTGSKATKQRSTVPAGADVVVLSSAEEDNMSEEASDNDSRTWSYTSSKDVEGVKAEEREGDRPGQEEEEVMLGNGSSEPASSGEEWRLPPKKRGRGGQRTIAESEDSEGNVEQEDGSGQTSPDERQGHMVEERQSRGADEGGGASGSEDSIEGGGKIRSTAVRIDRPGLMWQVRRRQSNEGKQKATQRSRAVQEKDIESDPEDDLQQPPRRRGSKAKKVQEQRVWERGEGTSRGMVGEARQRQIAEEMADTDSEAEGSSSSDEGEQGPSKKEGSVTWRRKMVQKHVTAVSMEQTEIEQYKWTLGMVDMKEWPEKWEAMV
jgi:hypothetical protein